MKPSTFTYHRPATTAEALAVLAEVGRHGKVLAGGQSLLPILNMRLAAPAHLVDINRLTELAYVRTDPSGVRVGALARHAQVERDDAAAAVQPLLRQALSLVAHPTIRNRGTVVGSLAHADPSGELTAVLVLTGGTVTLVSTPGSRIPDGVATHELSSRGAPVTGIPSRGAPVTDERANGPGIGSRREIAAADFFVGPLESAVRPGELAVEAFFPALPPRSGTAFVEVTRRHGDYAVCGVAAIVTLDDAGAVASARTAYVSMAPTPVVLDVTAQAPSGGPGQPLDDAVSWTAAGQAAAEGLDPEPDLHATAEYRSRLAQVLTARALARAAGAAAHELSSRGHPVTDIPSRGAPAPNEPDPGAAA